MWNRYSVTTPLHRRTAPEELQPLLHRSGQQQQQQHVCQAAAAAPIYIYLSAAAAAAATAAAVAAAVAASLSFKCSFLQLQGAMCVASTGSWPKERKANPRLKPPPQRYHPHQPHMAAPHPPPLQPPALHKRRPTSHLFPRPSLLRPLQALEWPCTPVVTSPSYARCHLKVVACCCCAHCQRVLC